MRRFLSLSALFLVPCLSGCADKPEKAGMEKPPPPEVTASAALTQTVMDYEDFPGRLEAVNAIEIKARVGGYLTKASFKEGAIVEKDAVLFEIDARPFEADLAFAEGHYVQSEGRLKRLDSDYERGTNLLASKSLSREEFDKIAGDRIEALGALEVAKASRAKAELNLEWTQVKAPLKGRVSRRFIDPGNMVKADDTVLTTLVDLDPIHATFDLDERTALRLKRMVREGVIKWSAAYPLPVRLGLADEEGFPHEGIINFADNRVDADTGTWRLRGLFPNSDQTLAPGLFVRVRLPMGQPYETVLVAEQALGTDQGQKFLYVVDGKNMVAKRQVKVGRIHDGRRAILQGLAKSELVIVSGLQRARPGIEVKPDVKDMPRAGGVQPPAKKKDEKIGK